MTIGIIPWYLICSNQLIKTASMIAISCHDIIYRLLPILNISTIHILSKYMKKRKKPKTKQKQLWILNLSRISWAMNVIDVKRDTIFPRARGGWGRELPRRVGDVRHVGDAQKRSCLSWKMQRWSRRGEGSIKREWKRENGDPSCRRK